MLQSETFPTRHRIVLVLSVLIAVIVGTIGFLLMNGSPNQDVSVGSPPPEILGSGIRYRVIGASSVTFLVAVKHRNSYYDYSYEVEMGKAIEGYLNMPPAPEDVQIQIIAISEEGTMSKPLITSNQWKDLPFFLFRQVIPYHFNIGDR